MVPVTKMRTQVHYETVMKTVQQTRVSAQDRHVDGSTAHHDLQDRDLHRDSAGDDLRQVVEECGSYETRMVPETSAATGCGHRCGHRCGGGCGSCIGGIFARSGRLLRHDRPGVPSSSSFPGPSSARSAKRRMSSSTGPGWFPFSEHRPGPRVPDRDGSRDGQCPGPRAAAPDEAVPVTVYEPKQVTENVPVTTTIMVPEQRTETVATVQTKEVTENVTRQVAVTVPVRSLVTTMITRERRVVEDVIQQVPVDVPVRVAFTVMSTSHRPVTEYVTKQVPSRSPSRCR